MYQVRRVNIGKTTQLDELAHACGEVYTNTLVSFWRTVRHKGIWLGPKDLMRWHPSTNNQRIHQWPFGTVRHMLTYKAQRLGMRVVLQDEHRTSRTCPACGTCRKSRPNGRVFRCTNKRCGLVWHRDGVGAVNIRRKYLALGPVVGAMAPPTGMRFQPHTRVARWEKMYQREAAGL